MRTMHAPNDHAELVARIRRLAPDQPRKWGTMSAPQMIAHLRDQMGHTLGDITPAPIVDFRRFSPVRYLAIYWVPWPRGRIQGPPEAFVTQPAHWEQDVEVLIALLGRFAARDVSLPWPDHAIFGTMSSRDWGVFCYKHFNHHLTQFGV
ncbi:MAG: DUF1569 domain-containing protein [Candidatus Hydrogenedentes bacterium]|nr:DUF1569 domain-containing protein [Candidatus Hydrogenedentota bacterium]